MRISSIWLLSSLCAALISAGAAHAADPPTTPPATPPATSTSTPQPKTRVFVASLLVGAGAEAGEVALIEGRLLTAARRQRGYDVVAARDVAALVDVAAVRAAAGCADSVSCESEIASALDAPQLVTGELGRVGQTWLLSLARTDRMTSSVLSRVSAEATGDSPEGLLRELDGAVAELFESEPAESDVDALFVAGVAGVGIGALGLAVGGGFALGSNLYFTSEKARLNELDAAARAQQRDASVALGNGLNTTAVVGAATGMVAVVGAILLIVDAAQGDEPAEGGKP